MKAANTVDAIWLGDHLGRREDADLLIDFLKARVSEQKDRNSAYVINLSAGWGAGKTFFLRKMKEQLVLTGHLVSYIDAWKDDDAAEPMVAVMAAMNETLKPHLGKKDAIATAWKVATSATGKALALTAKGISYQLMKKAIGPAVEGLNELGAAVEDKLVEEAIMEDTGNAISEVATKYIQGRIDAYESHRSATETFKKRVSEILKILSEKQVPSPYFILIDELDRCRPTYAVEMLEQVKHLFDVPGLCFVIATDGDQLAHSVSAVYGDKFDGKGYLRRFFNRRYKFREPDVRAYTKNLIDNSNMPIEKIKTLGGSSLDEFMSGAFVSYELTLRDIDQIFDVIRNFVTYWNSDVPIEMSYLIPLAVCNHVSKVDDFVDISNGSTGTIPNSWKVEFEVVDKINRKYVKKTKSVKSIIDTLSQLFNRTTDSVIREYDYSVHSESWAHNVIKKEHEIRFGNTYSLNDNSGRYTLLRQYAGQITNLSRLARDSE